MTTLTIPNDEMNEDSGLLINDVIKGIEDLGTLEASLLGNLWTGRGTIRAGDSTIREGEGAIRAGQNF